MISTPAPSRGELPSKVNVIARSHAHHSTKSGYSRLVDHVERDVPVKVLDGSNLQNLPQRVCALMARRSNHEWYSSRSFRLETDAFLRLLISRRAVVHFLYAEDDFRYLSHIRGVARLGHSGIAGTYHQPPSVLDRVVDPKSARRLDAVIALGSNQLDYFASVAGPERVVLIPHGVETDFYRPGREKQLDSRTCLFVGKWLRDFEMLREVIMCVGAKEPSLRFRVIAEERRASSFKDLKNVEFLSSVSDDELLRQYGSAHVLVLPFVDCVASNTLLEGLACGLPIVTTDVGGVTDYVTPECAYTVSPGDVEGMSEAILTLADDDGLREAMGVQSRLAALRFDWALVARKHMDVYSSLVA